MEKFLKNTMLILAAGLAFAGQTGAARAQTPPVCAGDPGNIEVYIKDDVCPLTNLHNTPLFTASNIAPGDSVSGTLRIKNAGADSQTVIIEAVDFSDPIPGDDLARALNITISLQGGSGYIYNNTLANFFNEREYKLATGFASGAENIYDVVVSFPADKGDDWQGKSTGFGLMVGFQGSDSKGVTLTTISGGGSAGGQIRGLIIQNEMAVTTTANTATITWNTNHAATSWVIYAKAGDTYSFDLTKNNYGYPYSTAETDLGVNKTTNHSVTVSGLEPNTTYYYRCVSHASLAVSVDHSFTTLAAGQVAGIQTERNGFEGASDVPTGINGATGAAADSGAEPGQVAGAQTERPDEASATVQNGKDAGTAAAKAGACPLNFSWWMFLILAAICGGRAWANKKSRWFWLAGGIVPLTLAAWVYFAGACVDWKLFAAMAVVLLVAWLADRSHK